MVENSAQINDNNNFSKRVGITLTVMILFVLVIIFISRYNQPQNVKTNASGYSNTPCQSYYKVGGAFSEGDIDGCVINIKVLLRAIHRYDVNHLTYLWTSQWNMLLLSLTYGMNLKIDIQGFQQTTNAMNEVPWAWPVKNLNVTGIVNMNTYNDLCAEAVCLCLVQFQQLRVQDQPSQ